MALQYERNIKLKIFDLPPQMTSAELLTHFQTIFRGRVLYANTWTNTVQEKLCWHACVSFQEYFDASRTLGRVRDVNGSAVKVALSRDGPTRDEIVVSNLPSNTTAHDVQAAFERVFEGCVTYVRIILKHRTFQQRVGVVIMDTEGDALAVMSRDGSRLGDHVITVTFIPD